MNTINLTAVYEPCEEGGYIAYIDEIQGINSQGETLEEAKENLVEAINLLFEEIRSEHTKVRSTKMKKLITQTLTLNL
jgi:predicted RNase H-like HicB family nuclease